MASAAEADAHGVESASSWRWLWRYLIGAAALTLLGLRYYGEGDPLAPLAMVELAFHEAGHVLTSWAPAPVTAIAGSVAQVLVPLLVGVHLLRRARDPLGAALALGWAGLSCHGVAVYVADAPYEDLPLVGGGTHDWAYLLGPEVWDRMDRAAALAEGVRITGIALVVLGVLWCLAVPVVVWLRGRSRSAEGLRPLPAWLGPPLPPASTDVPVGERDLPEVFPHPAAGRWDDRPASSPPATLPPGPSRTVRGGPDGER